jgi:2-polyprenyl-3-methyl-5-hydroxy-6-metoxy-1,4-benzoquinol methylase
MVVGVPLDSIIAASARSKGVETTQPSFEAALNSLSENEFDCVLISQLLHLMPCPERVISAISARLSRGTSVIVSLPNFTYFPILWRRMKRDRVLRGIRDFNLSGITPLTSRIVKKLFRTAELRVDEVSHVTSDRWRSYSEHFPPATQFLMSDAVVIRGTKAL